MTEIGVNHHQGWVDGGKSQRSLIHSLSLSLFLYLYHHLFVRSLCSLFNECKLITAALLLFGNPWLLVQQSDTLSSSHVSGHPYSLILLPPPFSLHLSHPPTLSVFPTFLCWCVTVMACHLAGMSCSPTSSPWFGVKHLLLVSDSRAHRHTHIWNASFSKMCSCRWCPLGCIPTLGVWPQQAQPFSDSPQLVFQL